MRRQTLPVNIGGVLMGGDYPIRIQSMINTNTGDIKASVQQCIRIINAGADLVRITVPSLRDAEAFAQIKEELRRLKYSTPLIADVHFNPEIALKVVEYADKVRVNPGNFKDVQKFRLLIDRCKNKKAALRIGVNHGSLSNKIMDEYGDTPEGMVQSAMEYIRICREKQFDQVVISMKSSNVRVMVYATRLIAKMMEEEGAYFPLHLGVTEAGEGEDGRIKSAAGIGTLLCEGIGDTIRVSLTEDPEIEIPVAARLIKEVERIEPVYDRQNLKYSFNKRKTRILGNLGGNQVPLVMGTDLLIDDSRAFHIGANDLTDTSFNELCSDNKAVLIYRTGDKKILTELKELRNKLEQKKCDIPVIFKYVTDERDRELFMLKSAIALSGAFIDGFGDGIWLQSDKVDKETLKSVALGVLQACRARMSKTEYISCPSCGRTNFNLMEAVSRIKAATSHLKGLKIGIMGCIVNGPGEMADADYGYVGSGKGSITLYKAKEVVMKNIPEEDAVSELIGLIKANGDWQEP